MTTDCINLKEAFGDRFKVAYEEAYLAEYGEGARRDDPWLQIILCQNGHICPWGGSSLAACTTTNGRVAAKLRRLPFVEIAQDGNDGINAVFDVAHFDRIAEIMKPRRRRRLSEAQKAANVERLRKYHPVKGQSVADVAAQAAREVETGDPSTCSV
jgi:hypothetical protein